MGHGSAAPHDLALSNSRRAFRAVVNLTLRATNLGGERPYSPSRTDVKLSTDPRFLEKFTGRRWPVRRSTGSCRRAVGRREEQIQALDRTQPGLPMKKGRAGTMTHDYNAARHTTLFAALNVLDGTVIGRCMQRHRHEEFIRFPQTPSSGRFRPGKLIHAIADKLRHP